jgi:hypothetical protein
MASIPRIEDFCIDTSASRLSKRPLPVALDGEYSPEERTRSSERLARLVELVGLETLIVGAQPLITSTDQTN